MRATIFGLDNAPPESVEVPPMRAFPRLIILPKMGGCGRTFLRRAEQGVGNGADEYDEVEPVYVRVVKVEGE